MKLEHLQKVLSIIGGVLRCPVCNAKYLKSATRVLDSEEHPVFSEAKILIHSDCSKCKSSVMFSIEVNGPEIFSVGVLTDLTHNDSSKFRNLPAIKPDDCIATHKFLKNFHGDLISALK